MQRFTFDSKSSPGVTYETLIDDAGQLSCNCRGWTMKKGGQARECTHTRQVAQGQGTPSAPAKSAPARKASPVLPEISPLLAERLGGAPRSPAPMLASAMVDAVTGAAFDKRYGSGWVMEEKIDGHRLTAIVRGGEVRAFARPQAGSTDGKARTLPENSRPAGPVPRRDIRRRARYR